MGKIEKTFWWFCFILVIYTVVGFKVLPDVIKNQLVKNLDETLTLKSSIEKVDFNPFIFKAKIYNYKLGDKDPTLQTDELLLDFGLLRSITDLHINIEEIKLRKLFLDIKEDKNGVLNLAKLLKPTGKTKEEKKEDVKESLKFLVSKLQLENSKINFTKHNKNKTYKISIHDINYKIRDIGTFKNSLSSNDLKLRINNSSKISLEGAFRLEPFKMYGKTKIENLLLNDFIEYDNDLFNFTLNKKASANLDLNFDINTKDKIDVSLNSNNFNINNIVLNQNNNQIAKLKKFDIQEFLFDLDKQKITIKSPKIDSLDLKLIQNKSGLNFAKLIKESKDTKKEETAKSKPWNIKLTNTNLKNINFIFNDKLNSIDIISSNINSKTSSLNILNSKIDLNNFILTTPNITFKDNNHALDITTKNINAKLSNLDIINSNINLNQINISTPTLNFVDNKNSLDISTSKLDIGVDTLNIKDNIIKMNSANIKNSLLEFKDKKLNLNISSKNNITKAKNLNINGSLVSIDKIDTNLSNVNFDDKKLKLNIKSNQAKSTANNLKVDGSNISIDKITLNNSNLDLNDKINKLDLNVKSTNIDLDSLKIKDSKVAIKSIRLKRPDISFKDNKNNLLINTKDLQVSLSNFSQENDKLGIDSIRIIQPKLKFLNTKDKTKIFADNIDLSVSKFFNSNKLLSIKKTILNKPTLSVILPKNNSKKEIKRKTKKTKQSSSSKKFNIGEISINSAKFNFEDKNLPLPFKTKISNLNGNISKFNSSKSSVSKLKVKGVVDKYGTAKITGDINPNSLKILTDINMIFKNIAMKNFTPYTGKFIGRKLDSGKLDLDLKYNIKKSNLKAKNNITIKKIKLGEKVQSKEAVSLPLELAIALLEDSNNVIDIDLPVKGNVDNPQFSIGSIVWKAFTNLIMKAVTAPFSLLGAIFGFEADEIKSVNFDYGKSLITPIQEETLDKISKILTKRPNIVIKLVPSYSQSKDINILRKDKLTNLIDKKLPNKNDKNYEEDYIELLEDLYEDYNQDVDLLKKKYTKNDKLNNELFKRNLENYIISKQEIKQEKLKDLANLRVDNIKEYLTKNKKVQAKQIEIDSKKLDKNNSNIELKIGKI